MVDAEPADLGRRAWWKSVAAEPTPVDLHVEVPHPARMYDYYLGGKDNFPADREAARQAETAFPNAAVAARANRAFMARAVRHLAAEAGIRQFLDIGTGMFFEIYLSHGDDEEGRYSPKDPCPRVLSAS